MLAIDLPNQLLSGRPGTGIRFIGQVESHGSSRRDGPAFELVPGVVGNRSETNTTLDPSGGESVLCGEVGKPGLRDVTIDLAA